MLYMNVNKFESFQSNNNISWIPDAEMIFRDMIDFLETFLKQFTKELK